jgi:hypothetical protein
MAKIVSQEINPKLRPKTKMASLTFFSCKNSNETPSSGLYRNNFLMQIGLKLSDATKKSNQTFWKKYFCSQYFSFQPISKNFSAFEASFYYLTFVEDFFFEKSKMAIKMASFF